MDLITPATAMSDAISAVAAVGEDVADATKGEDINGGGGGRDGLSGAVNPVAYREADDELSGVDWTTNPMHGSVGVLVMLPSFTATCIARTAWAWARIGEAGSLGDLAMKHS